MAKLTTQILTILALLAFMVFGLFGCDNDNDTIIVDSDPIPTTPQGVFSVTGDGVVWVYFNGIYESDVDHYIVYRSLDELTGYVAITNVDAVSNPNLDLIIYESADYGRINGVTYWYAVTAVDNAGQESELSAENVFDTPRPEGQATLFPNDFVSGSAGFNLATASVLDWTSPAADIWIDRTFDLDGPDTIWFPYINAGDDLTYIQDLGYTEDFDEISYAPLDGWSRLGYVEAIVGHTYVVWTNDDHYAKIRINSMTVSGAFSFTWGYQTDVSNLELAPLVRPEHDEEYPAPKPGKTTQLLK